MSSGAVAAGVAALGFTSRPADMRTLQAVSAVGQSRIMGVWNEELDAFGLTGAQVLVDPHDFVDRTQYLHARQTMARLLELGCVPIINENDAIANDELRYGDNDRIAALVAHSMKADVLVLLTDLDGLFTSDPARSIPTPSSSSTVGADDPLLSIRADAGGSGRGSGGMASKLSAARIASWSGVRTVIANAARERVLPEAVDGASVGTDVRRSRPPATGAEAVDRVRGRGSGRDRRRRRGAARAHRAFDEPAPGRRARRDRLRSARATRSTCRAPTARCSRAAWCTSTAADLRGVAGMQTRDLPEGMVHEVIHRDDLVVLSS